MVGVVVILAGVVVLLGTALGVQYAMLRQGCRERAELERHMARVMLERNEHQKALYHETQEVTRLRGQFNAISGNLTATNNARWQEKKERDAEVTKLKEKLKESEEAAVGVKRLADDLTRDLQEKEEARERAAQEVHRLRFVVEEQSDQLEAVQARASALEGTLEEISRKAQEMADISERREKAFAATQVQYDLACRRQDTEARRAAEEYAKRVKAESELTQLRAFLVELHSRVGKRIEGCVTMGYQQAADPMTELDQRCGSGRITLTGNNDLRVSNEQLREQLRGG
jgi:chromosome segregation ATPase